LMAATAKVCTRPPTPGAVWIHQIHATGGVGGFTTMVVLFVWWFVFFCVLSDSWHMSCSCHTYVLEVLHSEPPKLAPYRTTSFSHPLAVQRTPLIILRHRWVSWRCCLLSAGACNI
jgi:hypothetical protein